MGDGHGDTGSGTVGRRPHVVVVGGGIAGLAAAHAVLTKRPDVRVTVLEAGTQTGGKLRLGEVAGQQVDLGAEAILNRRPEGVGLARDVGLGDSVVHPVTTSAGIWTRGAVRRLPPTVMGVPSDLDALARSGIVGRRAVPRARLDRVLPKVDLAEDVSVGSLVGHRVGGEIRDRLVEPLLGGVYAGRADELSVRATVPQLAQALVEHGPLLEAAAPAGAAVRGEDTSEPRAAAPVFAGLHGGVGRLAVATEEAVRAAGGDVRCLSTVRELARTADGYRLVVGPTIAPETLDADAVIMAAPATPAARLVREVAPRASVELSRIPYASIAVVTLAFPAAEAPELTGSGFLVPPVDGREIKAATFSSVKWGWLSGDLVVVRCSIGRVGEERTLQRDDPSLVEAAVLDLREAVGLRARLLDAEVTRWGGALPQYLVGHLDRVRRVREAVAEAPGLAVCGAAYDGLGIPACIASAREAATRILEQLPARDTMRA